MELMIGGLFVVGYLIFAYSQHVRAQKAWSAVAARHDLTLKEPGFLVSPRLSGEHRGRDITVYTEKRGSRKNKKWYTVYETRLSKEVPVALEMYDESLFSKLGKVFGGEDIQVGRSQLDNAFIIKGGNAEEVREFLDDDHLEQALVALHQFESDVEIEHGKLKIEHRRKARSSSQIDGYLGELVDCADLLDERADSYQRPVRAESEGSGGEEADAQRDEEIDYVAEW